MNKIFFLFSRTDTLPSKLVHLFQGGEFTHISISVKPDTHKFYSFARKNINNPLISGFVFEDTKEFVFAKYPESTCALYSLDVSDEQYANIEKTLNFFVSKNEEFYYNFFGLLPAKLGIKMYRKRHYTCSQFVGALLYHAHAVELPKDFSLMMPNDFLNIKGLKKLYAGSVNKCFVPNAECINQ